MVAPKGNKFWMLRSSHGRKPIFKDPEQLWDAACEYFQWVEDNPLLADKVGFYQGIATHEPETRMRAMTIEGLLLFIDISKPTWYDYKNSQDFSTVVTRVEDIIRTQKFEGAAAELLNSNIIARDLGLKEGIDHTTKGKEINRTYVVADEETKNLLKDLDG